MQSVVGGTEARHSLSGRPASRAMCCKTNEMFPPAEIPPTEMEDGLMLRVVAELITQFKAAHASWKALPNIVSVFCQRMTFGRRNVVELLPGQ